MISDTLIIAQLVKQFPAFMAPKGLFIVFILVPMLTQMNTHPPIPHILFFSGTFWYCPPIYAEVSNTK